MPIHDQPYHTGIYQEFTAISERQWHNIVRFYEAHQDEINRLAFDEYFELLLAYTRALFETGAHEKHLAVIDLVIENAFRHNLVFYRGEEILTQALFRKAASCYHTSRFNEAIHILREVLRIDPEHRHAFRFLRKCFRRQQPSFLQKARAVALLMFLASATLALSEWIWIRSFFPEYTDFFVLLRYLTFGIGVALIMGSHLIHACQVERRAVPFLKKARRRKQRDILQR